jgi:hypothetical protein
MSLCPIKNQKQILKSIARLPNKATIQDIDNIIQKVLPDYTIEKALAEFDEEFKNILTNILKASGYSFDKDANNKEIRKLKSNKVMDIDSDFLSSEVTDLFS